MPRSTVPFVHRSPTDLIEDLRFRRTRGEPPPVMLLGAGASVGAGSTLMRDLMAALGCKTKHSFYRHIGELTEAERYFALFDLVQSRSYDPFRLTAGYRALGVLIYERYFDMVLTTNMDPLLEDAIANARMRRRDWLLLINGAMRLETMESLLSEREPRVKLLKLHGDLYHRTMAWTPPEMRSYLRGISQCLKIVLTGRDLLAVGHSLDDSAQIRKTAASVIAAGRALWYANVREPPEYLASRSTRFIGGDEGAFESLLPALADALSPEWSRISAETITPLQAEPVGPNPDDLAAAVVGVRFMERGGGPWGANCTGFLLADPRLIVSYGYTARSLLKPTNRVTILTRDGRPLETEMLGLIDTHPEGPWLLRAPPELRSPVWASLSSPSVRE